MKIRNTVALIVALLSGLLTALGYFIPFQPLADLSGGLLYIAVFLSSIAVIIGVINLSRIHLRKAVSGKSGGGYSILLIISMWITFLVVFIALSIRDEAGMLRKYPEVTVWFVRNIQLPLEASLSALVVFALLVGGVRLLYRRRDVMAFFFLGSALVVLLAVIPLPNLLTEYLSPLEEGRQSLVWMFLSVASGGGRGILLGMALGAAATGLRILIGVDRPYER
jgi:hypothetical protein